MIDDIRTWNMGKYYCLPIISQWCYLFSEFPEEPLEVCGLLLARSGPPGQYRRAGLFQSSSSPSDVKLFDRPSYLWEPSSMKIKYTPNMSQGNLVTDQMSTQDLDDLGEEEDDWVENVITII
jgi:hypothetical protein